jgi:hypothetical protein
MLTDELDFEIDIALHHLEVFVHTPVLVPLAVVSSVVRILLRVLCFLKRCVLPASW